MQRLGPSLSGVFNLRDLGGLRTRGGARVRVGRVLRSDGLHRLDAAGVHALAGFGLRKIFDLRATSEVREDVSIDIPGAERVHVPLVATTLSPFDPEIDWENIDFGTRYLEMLDAGGDAIRTVLLAAAAGEPLLFHCTAGKDRTGVVAAVLLRALEVEDRAIVEDYALSETNLRVFLAGLRDDLLLRGLPPAAIDYLTSSPPARMRSTLAELDRRWGSTAGYLRWIGVDDHTIGSLRLNLLC